eukprot:Skav236479  [mRNA]  locus=scaffold1440:97654:104110:+ [translate_table: standard]
MMTFQVPGDESDFCARLLHQLRRGGCWWGFTALLHGNLWAGLPQSSNSVAERSQVLTFALLGEFGQETLLSRQGAVQERQGAWYSKLFVFSCGATGSWLRMVLHQGKLHRPSATGRAVSILSREFSEYNLGSILNTFSLVHIEHSAFSKRATIAESRRGLVLALYSLSCIMFAVALLLEHYKVDGQQVASLSAFWAAIRASQWLAKLMGLPDQGDLMRFVGFFDWQAGFVVV